MLVWRGITILPLVQQNWTNYEISMPSEWCVCVGLVHRYFLVVDGAATIKMQHVNDEPNKRASKKRKKVSFAEIWVNFIKNLSFN